MKPSTLKLISCVSLLSVLVILMFFLVKDIITFSSLQNFDNALSVAETQDGFCTASQTLCVWEPNNGLVPNASFSTDFNLNTSLVLIDLVGRLEYFTDAPVTSPPNFTLVKTLQSPDSPIFCGMWTNSNNLYIIFRGTKTQAEWSKDLQTNQDAIIPGELQPLQKSWSGHAVSNDIILVHSGFLDVFQEFEVAIQTVINEIQPQNVYIAGHSLGAGVSQLAGMQYFDQGIPLVVYAFASPLVGNDAFAASVKANYVVHTISNRDDLIPLVPLNVMPNFSGDHSPYIYARAGTDHLFSTNWESWKNNHNIPIYINCLSNNTTCQLTTIVN